MMFLLGSGLYLLLFISIAFAIEDPSQLDKLQALETTLQTVIDRADRQQTEILALKAELHALTSSVQFTGSLGLPGNEQTNRRDEIDIKTPFMSKSTLNISSSSSRATMHQQNIGFTAVKHSPSPVYEGGTVIFETTITNYGSAYDPRSGIFTAPVSGMYVFFFDIECAKTNGDTYTELLRDGARVGIQTYCHGLGDYDNSASLGVLHLNAGDTVWVRLYDSDNRYFGGKTIFSGFMI